MSKQNLTSSFRDPSGFLYFEDGELYRQINKSYKKDYDLLINSGLYQELTSERLLISHHEETSAESDLIYKIIKPEQIKIIFYPYEWCFSQLKDAALLTLAIQKKALAKGLTLKDASAYNVQFHNGQMIFIDTLSFEQYRPDTPWVAYRQFCQHFLAPLVLASKTDLRFLQMSKNFIDGLPLDLASKLLPRKTYFSFSLLSHIHAHARTQAYYADKNIKTQKRKLSLHNLQALIYNLENTIAKLKCKNQKTEWANYYNHTNYSKSSSLHKTELVKQFLNQIKPSFVWDVGANDGHYSRLASQQGILTLATDIDPQAVESNYQQIKKNTEKNLVPLINDLINPSAGIGWNNHERLALTDRMPKDTILALALVHHLAISNNLPLINLAQFFAHHCQNLIIEFIPKTDSQVQKLLSTREDIFDNYTKEGFEVSFSKYFNLSQVADLNNSDRRLYLMIKK